MLLVISIFLQILGLHPLKFQKIFSITRTIFSHSRSEFLLKQNTIIVFLFTFQRFLLSITPEKEQQDIIDGKPGKRANLNHWISL